MPPRSDTVSARVAFGRAKLSRAKVRRLQPSMVLKVLSSVAMTLAALQAGAATLIVNDSTDVTAARDGQCTLREAVANVNAAMDISGGDCTAGSGAGDTIEFNLILPATITLTTKGALAISKDLHINGPTTGALAIDGNGQTGVLSITAGVVSLANLIIQNGHAVGTAGGGVYNNGIVTLNNCTLSGNSADADTGNGGGLYNDSAGTATLTDCTLSGNSVTSDDFGGGGAGLYNAGTVTLTNCTFTNNVASVGAGGGLYNDHAGTATLTNCTLSGNSSGIVGGGFYNGGHATLTNCTLGGNAAVNGDFNGSGGGLYTTVDGSSTLTNTIVANSPGGENCAGPVLDAGHNLSSDGTCFSPDSINVDPRLAPLANYGGQTATLALCTAVGMPDPSCTGPSPAIDDGDDAVTGPPLNLDTDQRGLPRKAGLHVDLGADEVQSAAPPACVGDCDGSGEVTVDELVTMVNIALGITPLPTCSAGDADGSGNITVNEIIVAVNNALTACPDS